MSGYHGCDFSSLLHFNVVVVIVVVAAVVAALVVAAVVATSFPFVRNYLICFEII